MLYVDNIDIAIAFWEAIGFSTKKFDENSAEIKSAIDAQVTFTLYTKSLIHEISPELLNNVPTPSLMFQSNDIEALYAKVLALGRNADEIMTVPGLGRVFNFTDPDGNYYAVSEVK
jgi:lactoylglutathione lyase